MTPIEKTVTAICGYCLGDAVYDDTLLSWVHATSGERVTDRSSGDFVSARHNRAGTVVLAYDLITS